MKVKMNFDPASIKSWLLAHGEKVALAVVGIVFCLFVYSTLGQESLDDKYEPEKLTSLAGSVEQHLTSSQWDAGREQLKVVNYANRAKTEEVKLVNFPLPNAFNPPVTDPKAKRGEPEIFAAEELRVAAGLDTFAVKADQAEDDQAAGQNAMLKAQPWAVVTGLVPVAREKQAFLALFANAVNYNEKADTPRYLRPVLERTEVTPGDPAAAKWEKVADTEPFEKTWRATSAEIISSKYYDKTLAAPLGDLPGGKWGESVSHPKVPLEGEELPQDVVEVHTQAGQHAAVEDEEVDAGASRQRPAAGAGNRAPATPVVAVGNHDAAAPATADGVEYVLLRAFDYTVQPGKRYRYRVTVRVANPNAGKHPRYLKDPETADKIELASPPSEATPVVTIPDGHGVLAGTIDGGSRYSEPSATILVTTIDARTGLKAAAELNEVRRGAVANTPPRKVMVRDPLSNKTQELNLGFKSNITVLDIYGGKDLSIRRKVPPITVPGEILLLDANGNMTVHGEMEDESQYETTLVKDETEDKPAGPLQKVPKVIGNPNR